MDRLIKKTYFEEVLLLEVLVLEAYIPNIQKYFYHLFFSLKELIFNVTLKYMVKFFTMQHIKKTSQNYYSFVFSSHEAHT